MKTILISVINHHLDDLGIEQEDNWQPFYFKPEELIGYWVVEEEDGVPEEIMVYIGAHKFVVQYSEEIVNELNEILETNNE